MRRFFFFFSNSSKKLFSFFYWTGLVGLGKLIRIAFFNSLNGMNFSDHLYSFSSDTILKLLDIGFPSFSWPDGLLRALFLCEMALEESCHQI